jgi:hypothetical protein
MITLAKVYICVKIQTSEFLKNHKYLIAQILIS